MSEEKRGKLIVIEGGDACGKRTQSEFLRQRLSDLIEPSIPPLLMSFPRYNTHLGQAIVRHLKGKTMLSEDHVRAPEDALIFQCMMVADRCHATAEISAHLRKGGHVVCDRWWQSAYVYGRSDGLDPVWLEEVHALLPLADLNILIDVPADTAAARRPVARDRYEESMKRREEVRQIYLNTWTSHRTKNPEAWKIVNGSKRTEEVHETVWGLVARFVE